MTALHPIGFARLGCGCLVARYYQLAARRTVEYIEEKGCRCSRSEHRRNRPLIVKPVAPSDAARLVVPAS